MKKFILLLIVLLVVGLGVFAYLHPDTARQQASALLARASSVRSATTSAPANAPAAAASSSPAAQATAATPAASSAATAAPTSPAPDPSTAAPGGIGSALAGALGGPSSPPPPPPAASAPTAASAPPAPAAPEAAPTAAATPPAAPVAAPAVVIPFETTSVNLADVDDGGHVDHVSGEYGPGRLGTLLNDGSDTSLWKPADHFTFPQEIVFSFYERLPVLVSAVVIAPPPDPATAPKSVEVWIAPPGKDGAFTKVAAQTLAAQSAEQRIEFPAAAAGHVKLRILSGQSSDRLAIGEVKILEARRAGYTALGERRPDVAAWKVSPRRAAQLGLDWLEQAAPAWNREHTCFGCHVQAQVLMGQAVARRNHYVVDEDAFAMLEGVTRKYEDGGGDDKYTWFGGSVSATQYGVMALAYTHDPASDGSKTADPSFLGALDWLIKHQLADGSIPVDREEPPIVQGKFLTTANTAFALVRAFQRSGDAKYKAAADRALTWIGGATPETTQDRVFKILALAQFGTPDERRAIPSVVAQLEADQQSDGGWKEIPKMEGSNALATGQVLYALKQAGTDVNSPMFRHAVGYLVRTQVRDTHQGDDGFWKDINSQDGRKSNFASTMWAAIGLAGAYSETSGGVDVLFESATTKPASRNVEIILDASGSMKLPLGKSTRWQTALDVLAKLLDALPPGFNVGMRTYGHRFPDRSPQTCSDTELVVPIAPLDRGRVLNVARNLHPRGETPLVRSVLDTPDDLRQAGGGSVVLITDGEESCHGDLKAAASTLKASGLDVTLNIVGFTLKGKTTEEALGALAASTGGRYYAAQNGDALARAVTIAALQTLTFDVVGADGRTVATGETGAGGLGLPPGTYRVVVKTPGQELTQPVDVVAGRDTVVKVAVRGNGFVIDR